MHLKTRSKSITIDSVDYPQSVIDSRYVVAEIIETVNGEPAQQLVT